MINGRLRKVALRDCGLVIADCRLKNKNLKSEIRNPKFNRPMLSAGNALGPGPRPKHPGNVNPATGGTPGKAGGLP
jgi:hypothetical protein